MRLKNVVAAFLVAGFLSSVLSGCVTTRLNPPVTMNTLPPDRCEAPYGKQARETMTTGGGTTCVIYIGNPEMKKAERKYTSSLAGLAKVKLTDAQKKQKSSQLMATWYSEASKAATKANCPAGMRKAADFPASSITCTARLTDGPPSATTN